MPYDLTWEDKGVFWHYSGDVSGAELLEATSIIYGDSRFDDLRYKLVDFLDVKSLSIEESDVALLAFQHRAAELSNPSIKTAIVVTKSSKPVEQFVAFFEMSKWEVEVFEDREAADIWLERDVKKV